MVKVDDLGDRRRLVAGGLIVGDDPEAFAPFRLFRPLRAVGDEILAGFRFRKAGSDRNRHRFHMVIVPPPR
jgi:hypothetical protein